ncbi:DUF3899 domain-containing protein [Brevibacillus laterosporus]|uniref:DUF3899 domain-containing protein n=1 Tax=Brevibacillus laterosporus TaxID=1465 RepID=A0AAP8U5J4_BRELA|nr:DUF3899 domain-containing protein [Brevibacillus laterosporus]MCR8980382.1 DUF3899 domain-containing protein [Brevibacillus laterosporus]MCZ0807537.1 DUF3899 domain-containing protein [Brevibacillus laterosporus]MCZ0825973.1 DUF3899 domain-containing protein [Brevibacillus laterosporus]MCZ0849659.1 DUF3899 domain-containing protein [Brevibacillus laterosporus]MED1663532.1 DUF3899 domain-containing protein [Brevibacillus laterosporus]
MDTIMDTMFLTGLLLVLGGAIIYVWLTNFFAAFMKGFYLLGSTLFKKSKALQQIDAQLAEDTNLQEWKRKRARQLMVLLLAVGMLLIILSLIWAGIQLS